MTVYRVRARELPGPVAPDGGRALVRVAAGPGGFSLVGAREEDFPAVYDARARRYVRQVTVIVRVTIDEADPEFASCETEDVAAPLSVSPAAPEASLVTRPAAPPQAEP